VFGYGVFRQNSVEDKMIGDGVELLANLNYSYEKSNVPNGLTNEDVHDALRNF